MWAGQGQASLVVDGSPEKAVSLNVQLPYSQPYSLTGEIRQLLINTRGSRRFARRNSARGSFVFFRNIPFGRRERLGIVRLWRIVTKHPLLWLLPSASCSRQLGSSIAVCSIGLLLAPPQLGNWREVPTKINAKKKRTEVWLICGQESETELEIVYSEPRTHLKQELEVA